jgi:hypothetical protein
MKQRLTRIMILRTPEGLQERLWRVAEARGGLGASAVAREGILKFLQHEEARLGIKVDREQAGPGAT